jgi:hypothetical protein
MKMRGDWIMRYSKVALEQQILLMLTYRSVLAAISSLIRRLLEPHIINHASSSTKIRLLESVLTTRYFKYKGQ